MTGFSSFIDFNLIMHAELATIPQGLLIALEIEAHHVLADAKVALHIC